MGEPAGTKKLSTQGVPVAESIRLDPRRRMAAEHLTESHLNTAPVTMLGEVEAGRLLNLRDRLNESAKPNKNARISLTQLRVQLTAESLLKHPGLNATLEEGEIRILAEINLGMALALPDNNLIVPVIREADRLSVAEIAEKAEELTEKGRANKLTLPDVRGGTFTVSNAGMVPSARFTTPIIHRPQCAILAFGAVREAPVVRNGQVVAGLLLPVSLTFDHRVVNGLPAAEFLETLFGLLREPGSAVGLSEAS